METAEIVEQPINLEEAKRLMEVLENDIPVMEKERIALLLLVLSANPEYAKDGDIVTSKRKQRSSYVYDGEYGDYYGYGW